MQIKTINAETIRKMYRMTDEVAVAAVAAEVEEATEMTQEATEMTEEVEAVHFDATTVSVISEIAETEIITTAVPIPAIDETKGAAVVTEAGRLPSTVKPLIG